LKTFYCGVDGWRERQLPDGTLILTAPTGHTYLTKPGSVQLFPTLCQPTATLWAPGDEPTVPPSDGRGLMMPGADAPEPKTFPAESKPNANSTTSMSPNATDRTV
jgi:hypothetical protein